MKTASPYSLRFILFATAVTAIGGFLFGYDTAVINGANSYLKAHMNLNPAQEGIAGASAILGCIPGAMCAGFLSDRYGRKRILFLSAVLYAVSGVLSAVPNTFGQFLSARLISGLGIGASSIICPIYIAEIAPEKWRGRLGTLFQLGIVLGIFLTLFVNKVIQGMGDEAWNTAYGWRWMMGMEAAPALIFMALLFAVPESPRWLAQKGREGEAREILKKVGGPELAEKELSAIRAAAGREEGKFSELLSGPFFRPLALAVALMAFSQFCGINAIAYYSTKIFATAGGGKSAAFTASAWVGLINMIFTIVGLCLVDKAGRRPLLLVGAAVQTVALGLVGWMFHAQQGGIGLLICVIMFTAAFNLAMGPISWLFCSEIFPNKVRGRAMSVAAFTIWVSCYIVAQTFPMLNDNPAIGPAQTFWVYTAISLLSFVFIVAFIPETKGRTLEQIEQSWRRSPAGVNGDDSRRRNDRNERTSMNKMMIMGFGVFCLTSVASGVVIETAVPASAIKVTASSTYGAAQSAQNLIDGCGLNGDTHDNNQYAATMWHTVEKAAASPVAGIQSPAWVLFDFARPQIVEKILIWNHNQANLTDRGFRKTKILGTIDGASWFSMAEVELPQANGQAGISTAVSVSTKTPLKAVVIAADSNWGGNVYGLSEVQFVFSQNVAESDLPFPKDMDCAPQPVYRFRADGKPGREIVLNLKGEKLFGMARMEVTADGRTEISEVSPMVGGRSVCRVLLPADVGMKQESQVNLTLRQGAKALKKTVTVPAMRHWTVYLYPHSHVDIGYSVTQDISEFIHKRNIEEGIKLAEATKDYPAGARYRWNPEVTWALERLWRTAAPEQKERVEKAIRDGHLCVDASYANLNTSICSDEELFQDLRFGRAMQKLTGVPIDTFQQMDVPGMSWGLVPVLAQEGVRYIMAWPNPGDAGHAHIIDGRPFWWVGPDGKSKVLFLQPGGYGNSGSMAKGGTTGRPWFGQRDPDKIPAVIKTGSANVNFVDKLAGLENEKYPYDFLVLSWCLWDNCPLDADLPDAVKAWNEQYAYPRIIIAGGHEIMRTIEQNYGDKLPVVTGDFTEYWTDGFGTAARLSAINRNAKERLVQAETLWTMLRPGKPAPRAAFDEAWRYIILGDEHTWGAENTSEPFFQDAIWKVKESYFHEAGDRTQTLFDDALAPATDKSIGAFGPADGPANGGEAVFNTHSWKHGGLVTLSKAESSRGDRVTDDQDKDVPAQRLSTGELAFLASDIPAFGSRHYRVVAGKCPLTDGCKLNGTTLENQLMRVTIDPATGNITHLVNLATGRNLADAKVNGGLNAFRWTPGASDNTQADTGISIATVESGPLVVELRVSSKAAGCRAVTRAVRLVLGQPWVEIANVVDKLPLVAKDGIHYGFDIPLQTWSAGRPGYGIHFGFGFDIPQATTRVDIPWGVMEVEKDQWAAGNRNWIAMQRWLDISNDKEGITWCSLDAPLFESGAMTGSWDGEPIPWLSKLERSSTIYSWVMNNHWLTNFPLTQDGPVTFRYRILPHGLYDPASANRFGLEQAQPLAHVAANNDPKLVPLVALDNDQVFVTIIKPLGDGKATVLRLHSVSGKSESVKLTWPAGQPKSIRVCPLEETPGEHVGGDVSLPPYGVITLCIEYK